MLDLAMQRQEEYVSLNDIAQRQKISMKYLESIVGMLNKAGLLQSRRGKDGGYRMARRPEEYPVSEILKLTEGTLAPVSCMGTGKAAARSVSFSASCLTSTDVESTGRNYRRISFQRIDPGSAGWEALTLAPEMERMTDMRVYADQGCNHQPE